MDDVVQAFLDEIERVRELRAGRSAGTTDASMWIALALRDSFKRRLPPSCSGLLVEDNAIYWACPIGPCHHFTCSVLNTLGVDRRDQDVADAFEFALVLVSGAE